MHPRRHPILKWGASGLLVGGLVGWWLAGTSVVYFGRAPQVQLVAGSSYLWLFCEWNARAFGASANQLGNTGLDSLDNQSLIALFESLADNTEPAEPGVPITGSSLSVSDPDFDAMLERLNIDRGQFPPEHITRFRELLWASAAQSALTSRLVAGRPSGMYMEIKPIGESQYWSLDPTWKLARAPGQASLRIPTWIVLLLFATPAALLWWVDLRGFRAGHCQRCGYNLRTSVGPRCSECGADAKCIPPRGWSTPICLMLIVAIVGSIPCIGNLRWNYAGSFCDVTFHLTASMLKIGRETRPYPNRLIIDERPVATQIAPSVSLIRQPIWAMWVLAALPWLFFMTSRRRVPARMCRACGFDLKAAGTEACLRCAENERGDSERRATKAVAAQRTTHLDSPLCKRGQDA